MRSSRWLSRVALVILLISGLTAAGCVTPDVWARADDDLEIRGAVPAAGISDQLRRAGQAAQVGPENGASPVETSDGFILYQQPIHTDLGILQLNALPAGLIVDLGAPPKELITSRQALLNWVALSLEPGLLDAAAEAAPELSRHLVMVDSSYDEALTSRADYQAVLATTLGTPAPETHPQVVAVAVGLFPSRRGWIDSKQGFESVERIVLLPERISPPASRQRRAVAEAVAATPVAVLADTTTIAMLPAFPITIGPLWVASGLTRGIMGIRRDGDRWTGAPSEHTLKKLRLTPTTLPAIRSRNHPQGDTGSGD